MVKFRICQKLINLFPLLYSGQWFSFTEIIAMYSMELYSYTFRNTCLCDMLFSWIAYYTVCQLYSYTFKNTCLCDMLFLELHITQFVSQNVDFRLLYLQPLTKLQNLRPKLKAPQIRLYWRITRFETTYCKKFARPLSFRVAFTTLHFFKSWRAQFLNNKYSTRITWFV